MIAVAQEEKKSSERKILHVDMDAYFASVNALGHPEWRNRPVIVAGNPTLRTVVSSCNYIAKRRGVKAGMPLTRALRLIPEAVLTEGNFHMYNTYTKCILKILLSYTPIVEPVSIDEAFMQLPEYENPSQTARIIQKRILEETELWASIGIGRNKLLAKIASREAKPKGICTLTPEDLPDLSVEKIWGVGHETAMILKKFGITRIGDIYNLNIRQLRLVLGVCGEVLFFLCRGIDHTPVMTCDESEAPKSIGHEYTFARDVVLPEHFLPVLAMIAQKVARRSRDKGYKGSSITLKYRLANLRSHTKTRKISGETSQDQMIFNVARKMALETIKFPIRLIGISLGRLVPASCVQEELFPEKCIVINNITDTIRHRYGEKMIMNGRCLEAFKVKELLSSDSGSIYLNSKETKIS